MGTENESKVTSEQVDNSQSDDGGKNGKKKGFYIGLVLVLIVVIAGYIGIANYYGSHFFRNTVINGVNVGNKTAEQVDSEVFKEKEYNLALYSRGVDEEKLSATVSGNAIGYKAVYSEKASDILARQNKFAWIGGLFGRNEVVVEVNGVYDETLLEQLLSNIYFMQPENMMAPVDACIAPYNKEDGKYVIAPEQAGNKFDVAKAKELIIEALAKENELLDLSEHDIYESPVVLSDDQALHERLELLNTTMGGIITYTFGEDTEVVDADVFENWFNVNNAKEPVDKDKVREYVEGLAQKYNTYGVEENFKTKDGYVLHLRKGLYGWEIDVDEETELLYADIVSGNKISREPAFSHRAASFGESDIGDTYIEVDMTNQKVYVWDKGEIIIESNVVTGSYYGGHATPSGIYAIYGMAKNRILRGPDYASFVYYWMPFNKAIGLHDATWRSSFGGKIYLYSGSHGCINLPLKVAKEIYNFIYIDLPVVTYYLDDELIVSRPEGLETEEEVEEEEDDDTEKVVVDLEAISSNSASE